jgi:hypothetical protein
MFITFRICRNFKFRVMKIQALYYTSLFCLTSYYKNLLTLILTAYGQKDPFFKIAMSPGWLSKILKKKNYPTKYLNKLFCFRGFPLTRHFQ